MKYKGIIFDLDGVICHTDRFHYAAWKALADRLNTPFDEEINQRLRGVSRMESLDIVLEQCPRSFTQEEKEELAEEKNSNYRKFLTGMTPSDMTEDTKETLVKLRVEGIKLAVGSSSKNAQYILERMGAEGFFDGVCDGTQIAHSKPHPEVFLKAAQILGIVPEKCLVVEDAFSGYEAACAAGMDCAAVGGGLWESKAKYRLEKLSDLLEIVL
ncbi:MAG TPA: beta-phosphoglucomutase [Candidatus Mediterraneibacter pullicola]|mgnify:FL=1|uniref:Beta-phosphoglucomutase n=1 Tax=Candidatus Mediterraneibacter pullicola TaxID=2838682 RepID=A0A9D2H8J8_9FIRM|nr:beta-phosphoglucomutase [Candidatus Mediterraneibacter pullicola]